MNTPVFVVTKFAQATYEDRNIRQHRKEDHFCQSILALDYTASPYGNGMARELVNIRWYHRKGSQVWHCCVWINIPLTRHGLGDTAFNTGGGGQGQPGWGVNAYHLSLTRALQDAGIEFTRPDNAMCDISIEEYSREVIAAIMDAVEKLDGYDRPVYILTCAHP
jgi:hypothetical protein